MNESIELHDSELVSLSEAAGSVVVGLSAYIHRTEAEPGVDWGTGWVGSVIISFDTACLTTVPSKLPATIGEGSLQTRIGNFSNVIPLPMEACGGVELSVALCNGESLIIRGEATRIHLDGVPVFVERFNP